MADYDENLQSSIAIVAVIVHRLMEEIHIVTEYEVSDRFQYLDIYALGNVQEAVLFQFFKFLQEFFLCFFGSPAKQINIIEYLFRKSPISPF